MNQLFKHVTLVTGGDCVCESRAGNLSKGYLGICWKCYTIYSLRLKCMSWSLMIEFFLDSYGIGNDFQKVCSFKFDLLKKNLFKGANAGNTGNLNIN